jgi:nitrous oxide reductase
MSDPKARMNQPGVDERSTDQQNTDQENHGSIDRRTFLGKSAVALAGGAVFANTALTIESRCATSATAAAATTSI